MVHSSLAASWMSMNSDIKASCCNVGYRKVRFSEEQPICQPFESSEFDVVGSIIIHTLSCLGGMYRDTRVLMTKF